MIIRFSRAAQSDLREIHDYIAKDNPAAARKVFSQIIAATRRLEDFPLSGRSGFRPDTRELVVPRLPYIAVYQVLETTVDIIAVFHAAQDRPRGY
jgi:toxin ParE1/3/4